VDSAGDHAYNKEWLSQSRTDIMTQVGHVFISHAIEDIANARLLRDELQKAEINTWLAEDSIKPGEDWDASIQEALRTASDGLLLLSFSAINSPDVVAEYHYFLRQNKRLYVVMFMALHPSVIPLRLRSLPIVDLSDDYDTGIQRLIDLIKQRPVVFRQTQTAVPEKVDKLSGRRRVKLRLPSDRLNADELANLVERLASAGVEDIEIIEEANQNAG
jgi:hypothetical protein